MFSVKPRDKMNCRSTTPTLQGVWLAGSLQQDRYLRNILGIPGNLPQQLAGQVICPTILGIPGNLPHPPKTYQVICPKPSLLHPFELVDPNRAGQRTPMLSADKDLLLAKLNQDLLGLHLLELNTVLNRFQNAIGASSLLGGFAFAGIVELQLIDGENQTQLLAESVFYLSASLTLALAMFVMSVSTYASILGYRLSIQSTDQQSITRATSMLLGYYKWVLLAGVLALFTIIIASMAVVFFKAEKTVRWPATIIFLVSIPVPPLAQI